MIEVQAPQPWSGGPLVFLSGSIEMGAAERWQDVVIAALREVSGVVLNPRRDDWDSSWRQDRTDGRFVEQVTWELAALAASDIVLIYFAPGTKSPITLLELGLRLGNDHLPDQTVVCCPDGFWRRGNVELTCLSRGVAVLPDLAAAIEVVKRQF